MTRSAGTVMHRVGKWCVCVATCVLLPQYAAAAFTAYHDCALRTGEAGVAGYFSTNTPLIGLVDVTVPLRNSASGVNLPVSVRFSGDGWNGGLDGNLPGTLVGSDAYQIFQGKVPYYPGYQEVNNGATASFSFSGLDPLKSYTFTLMAGRANAILYSNRYTRLTISGAESFTNASSTGVEQLDEGATCRNMAANEAGRVMQYIGIRSGSDGAIQFSVSGDTSPGYMNAFMLEEFDVVVPPSGDSLYFKGTAEPAAGWTNLSFDTTSWIVGGPMYGFGETATFATALSDMLNNYSTLYIRMPFVVTNASTVESLTLNIDYDDAFVAYVNGQQVVASAGTPASPTRNSLSTVSHESSIGDVGFAQAVESHLFSVSGLVTGTNILAIQGFNLSIGSSDFVLSPAISVQYTQGGSGTSSVTSGPADIRQYLPSSRRSALSISEIMYNPPRAYSNDMEFVEIYNSEPVAVDLTGYTLRGDISYNFPTGQTLDARSFLVIAKNPTWIDSHYSHAGVLGPYSNNLSNGGGTVRLRGSMNEILNEVNYKTSGDWPLAANGAGHSLVLARPDYGEDNPKAWEASLLREGTPGHSNRMPTNSPIVNVRINEILAHTDPPLADTVEIYNANTVSVSIAGCYLSNDPDDLTKYQIPSGTLGPRSCIIVTNGQPGAVANMFGLSAKGNRLYLTEPGLLRVIDAVKYEAQENAVSIGRFPDGGPLWSPLNTRTLGSLNTTTTAKTREIVINEIMCDPISGDDGDQYVEIHNRMSTNINLGYWRFTDGIDFMFPAGTVIGPTGFVVIAKNAVQLRSKNANLTTANCLGDFGGTLSSGGEHLALGKPDDMLLPNQDFIVMDEVTFDAAWGTWVNAGGSSLELTDPNSENRMQMNWAGSDESAKSAWKTYSVTDVLNYGITNGYNKDDNWEDSLANRNTSVLLFRRIILYGLDAGESLIDNITLTKSGYGNVAVDNNSFESNLTSWTLRGNQSRSYIQSEGAPSAGSKSLHLVAEGDGDNRANFIGANMADVFQPNDTCTFSAQARWIAGSRLVYLKMIGAYIELPIILDIPGNLGTPGKPNSRKVANAGPAISDVQHYPLLPTSTAGAKVFARVYDPNGIASVQLYYRKDPGAYGSGTTMNDSGTGGDALAGDGIYTAVIPGDADKTAVYAFKVVASDGSVQSVYPPDAPASNPGGSVYAHEGLVMFNQAKQAGDTNVNYTFGTLRLWMTRQTRTAYTNRLLHMENNTFPCVLVTDNARAIYTADSRYRGSGWNRASSESESAPWVDPKLEYGMVSRWFDGNINWHPNVQQCFAVKLPDDDQLQASGALNLDNLRIHGGTVYNEIMAQYMLKKLNEPYEHCRPVEVYVNEVRKSWIYQDAHFPGNDYNKEFETGSGDWYELSDWREWSVDNKTIAAAGDDFYARMNLRKNPDGTHKRSMYRARFIKKVGDPADDNWDTFYPSMEALNLPLGDLYDRRVRATVDIGAWSKTIAIRHVLGDWDGYGFNTGKNMFYFVGDNSPSKLVGYDLDGALSGGTNDIILPPASPAVRHNDSIDFFDDSVIWRKFLAHSRFKRSYLRAVWNMYDKTFKSSGSNTVGQYATDLYNAMDAANIPTHAADYVREVDGGIRAMSVQPPTYYMNSWVDGRRSYLGSVLSPFTSVVFAVTGGGGVQSVSPVTLSGTAPIQVEDIRINGITYDAKWTGDTAWQIQVGMTNVCTNRLTLTAWDSDGVSVGTQLTVNIDFSAGTVPSPTNYLIINEIMYNGTNAGGNFVEIFNRATNKTYAVNGWKLNGVDFTFDAGTLLGPTSYMVVAEDKTAYARLYTNSECVVGSYNGSLQNSGETLQLLFPSVVGTLTNWSVIDEVKYDITAPWPVAANGMGPSLQLLDWQADNNKASSWYSLASNAVSRYTPGMSNAVSSNMPAYPRLWINEIMPNNTTGPTDNAGERAPFVELLNTGTSNYNLGDGTYYLTDDLSNLTKSPITLTQNVAGSGRLAVWCDGNTGQNAAGYPHVNFTLGSATGVVALVRTAGGFNLVIDYLRYGAISTNKSFGSYPEGSTDRQIFDQPTAGTTNNPISDLPEVKINEWMADNGTIIANPVGSQFDDWFELYNAGSQPVDLNGFSLTASIANTKDFVVPIPTVIPAYGYMLVWADKQSAANEPGSDLHASFKLSKDGSYLALYAPDGRVVDAVTFGPQLSDISEGRYGDGSLYTNQMAIPTPGAANKIMTMTVAPPAGGGGGAIQLNWETRKTLQYRLMVRSSMTTGDWIQYGPDIIAGADSLTTNLPASSSSMWYRLIQVH